MTTTNSQPDSPQSGLPQATTNGRRDSANRPPDNLTIVLELKVRMEEIAAANGDLHNLLVATEIATLFLDRELCVKRYTPRAAELFNLRANDLGWPIWHLRSKLDYPVLEAAVRQVLASLVHAPLHGASRGTTNQSADDTKAIDG